MKILFVGEIVAKPGRSAIAQVLPRVINTHRPDVVIANVENLTHGKGVTLAHLTEMAKAGIDVFTSGDHIFFNHDYKDAFEKFNLLRPANFPDDVTLGAGFKVLDLGALGAILVINLMGRTVFGGSAHYLDDPFRKAKQILASFASTPKLVTLIDFHADATSEKNAFAFYMDGLVDAIIGTSTHIPTCDHRKLPKGTLYVTDVGMVGNIDSVLGVKKEIIIDQFLSATNQRFEWEEYGACAFRSLLIDVSAKSIQRLDEYLE